MSRAKVHVHKGDTVVVISGPQKGSKGLVKEVNPTKSTAIVEGVRIITKSVKKAEGREGGLVKKEGPIHTSNLKIVGAEASAPAPAKKAAKKAAKKVAKKAAKSE